MNKISVKVMLLATAVITCININTYKASAAIFGDLNNDSIVDMKDLGVAVTNYNSKNAQYDLNKDGIVDIYDIVKIAKNIDGSLYKVYDANGQLVKGYGNGQFVNAVQQAGSLSGGRVISNGNVVWDRSAYWVYDGETINGKYNTMFTAMEAGKSLNNGRVISKRGVLLLDELSNYKAIVGVTQDDLDLRTAPQWYPKSGIDVIKAAPIRIDQRTKGFYKVSYFNKDNNSEYLTGYVPRYIDFIQDDLKNSMLGYVAAEEESNANPGCISNNPGDIGGLSVGVWQFSANMGSLDSFRIWLAGRQPAFYNILNEAWLKDGGQPKIYGQNFIDAWKSVATNNYDEFYDVQQEYAKKIFYDVLDSKLKANGYDTSYKIKFNAIRNMFWSTAIQHGATGAYRIISNCMWIQDMNSFIDTVYEGRKAVIDASGNSQEIKDAVKVRFDREKATMQRAYTREVTY